MPETSTPTRWHTGNAHDCARDHAVCEGPTVVARVTGEGYPVGKGWGPRSAARAKLIAIAPEMLDALRDAYSHITLIGSGQNPPLSNAEMCNRLGTIIAKAEGKSGPA